MRRQRRGNAGLTISQLTAGNLQQGLGQVRGLDFGFFFYHNRSFF